MSLSDAFFAICQDAESPKRFFVTLYKDVPYYGGPEEGGWYGTDSIVVAYQEFPDEQSARDAADKVHKYADELSVTARNDYYEMCRRQCDAAERRGMDVDDLYPEDGGPSKYRVRVCKEVPTNHYGSRGYE